MANHGAEDSGCQTLVDMGFDRATAQRVLDESGGDVNFAVAMLLSVTDINGMPTDQGDLSPQAAGVGFDSAAADVEDGDSQLQEAIRLSELEEERRRKQDALRAWTAEEERRRRQELAQSQFAPTPSASSASAGGHAPRRVGGSLGPTAGAKLISPPLMMGAPQAMRNRGLDAVPPSRGGSKRRPGPLTDPLGDAVGIDDLDSWPESGGSHSISSLNGDMRLLHNLDAGGGLGRRATPLMSRPTSTSGSQSGSRTNASGNVVSVEDLDHWSSGTTNVLSPALLPELRRQGTGRGSGFMGRSGLSASSSAPWLGKTSPTYRAERHTPPGSASMDATAARAAATAAAAGARPPSRAGLPSRGAFAGRSAMPASRSAPSLAVAGVTLTYEGPSGRF